MTVTPPVVGAPLHGVSTDIVVSNDPPSLVAPQTIVRIEEALHTFAKAYRAVQLYLPNNPTRTKALAVTRDAFAAVWQCADSLKLEIRESELLCEGESVYRDAERGTEGLPWLLYRDGLRELEFLPGFETEELDALVQLLQRSRTASPDEDDLVTLFWVADFSSIRHRHVEIGGESDLPVLRNGTEGVATFSREGAPLAVPAVESIAPGEGPPPGIVRVEDFDSTLYFLDQRELAYLQEEVRREFATDGRHDVLSILFDVLETQPSVEAQRETIQILNALLIELVSAANYEHAAFMLRESREVLRRATKLPAQTRTALTNLPIKLSEPAVIAQLLQSLDEATRAPTVSVLESLFTELRPEAMPPLFSWLASATASPTRAAIEKAATQLASSHTAALVELLEHSDLNVVKGALRLATRLKSPAAVPGLTKLLRHQAAELRMDSVVALGEIGSPGSLQAIERAIDDDDRDVRVASLRAIAASRHVSALPRLAQALRRKDLQKADLTEKMALFEAYGLMCGNEGVPVLDALLNGRALLGHRETPELRACAARALGLVATQAATTALNRAHDTKDVVVRTAVQRALRGGA